MMHVDEALEKVSKLNSDSIDLTGKNITDGYAQVEKLCNFLQADKKVSELVLANNAIGDAGASTLSEMLKINKTLSRIILRVVSCKGKIDNNGAKYLSLALKFNNTLTHLDLMGNLITKIGCEFLISALETNHAIIVLYIPTIDLDDILMKSFKQRISYNCKLRDKFLEAAQNGDINGVRQSLEVDRVSVHVSDARGMTALHLAAENGHSHIIEFLMAFGANIILKNLANQSMLDIARDTLVTLTLSNCHLTDSDIDYIATRLAQFTKLTSLNLDNNYISTNGFQLIVRYLPPQLKEFSLRNNYIDYVEASIPRLAEMSRLLHNGLKINLSGNFIESKTHNKQVMHSLRILLTKCNASIDIIISTVFKELHTISDNEYQLILKLPDRTKLRITLNYFEMVNITPPQNILCNEMKLTERAYFNSVLKMNDNKGLINPELLGQVVFNKRTDDSMIKSIGKELMDYHPQAPIKSYIRTHSFFRSPQLSEVKSILQPNLVISLDIWMVYIIAKDQHAFLAYEGLTNHGQRIFKVVHLTAVLSGNWQKLKNIMFGGGTATIKEFKCGSLRETVEYIKKKCIWAVFSGSRGCVKSLQKKINSEKDTFTQEYQMIISSNTDGINIDEQQVNCIKWATDRVSTYLNIKIPQELLGSIPSTVVDNLRKLGEPVNLNNLKPATTLTPP